MFSISHYWAIQIRRHLRLAHAGFWKEKRKILSFWAALFKSYCLSFRHRPFNNVALSYNTFKCISNGTLILTLVQYCIWIGQKDVVLDLVAGAYVNSVQVRLRTVLTNAPAYCLATLGPIAVTESCKMYSLSWFCLNSIWCLLHSFCHIHFVSRRKIFNLSGLFCPTSIK